MQRFAPREGSHAQDIYKRSAVTSVEARIAPEPRGHRDRYGLAWVNVPGAGQDNRSHL